MDLIWSLGLIVVLLLALNHMAGGRAANVLRPATSILNNLIALVVRWVLTMFGTILKLGGGSIKLPKPGPLPKDEQRGPGPPPTRWD